MWKNRLAYILLAVVLAVLLFWYASPFLLCSLILLGLLAVLSALLLRREARQLHIEAEIASGAHEGGTLLLQLEADGQKKLPGVRSIILTVSVKNNLLGETKEKKILLPMTDGRREFCIPISTGCCGGLRICCVKAEARDILQLFRSRISPFREVDSVIYPRTLQGVEVELSHMTIGEPRDGGHMLNRRGSDLTETFDIREYVPGDDIRSIHWKLSGKVQQLILREPSDPSHYDVVILPDFGKIQGESRVQPEEINTAAACVFTIGEKLLGQGGKFCLALPYGHGIHPFEVQSRRELQHAMTWWMSVELQPESGMGLKYFQRERLQHSFSRLLIVSAGRYAPNLAALSGQIGVTVLSAAAEAETFYAGRNGAYTQVEIPAREDYAGAEVLRVISV